MTIFTDPTALFAELANYHPEYDLPRATPECVASLIDDTDPGEDPQFVGLDKLAAQTIRTLAKALTEIDAHATASIAQRAPSDDVIIAEHIEAIRDEARAALAAAAPGVAGKDA